MSKSTLSIFLKGGGFTVDRTVEIPCRLPESFDFDVFVAGHGIIRCVAYLTDGAISDTEATDYEGFDISHKMESTASVILGAAKTQLDRNGGDMSATPLPAIALAYEAECAAHDAQVKALRSLPRAMQNPGMVFTHPSERETYAGGAVGMLAKYVEWVFEQACKTQTERAEAAAKVAP